MPTPSVTPLAGTPLSLQAGRTHTLRLAAGTRLYVRSGTGRLFTPPPQLPILLVAPRTYLQAESCVQLTETGLYEIQVHTLLELIVIAPPPTRMQQWLRACLCRMKTLSSLQKGRRGLAQP